MDYDSIKKMIVPPDTTLKAAIRLIGLTSTRMLFVVDRKERLAGSLSDGDIRRAIINGVSFESSLDRVMCNAPHTVRSSDIDSRERAMRCIVEERLFAIPVLDSGGKIEDILLWYDFFEKHPHEQAMPGPFPNTVVIMAGGKGARLDPFTKILPKALIPIGEKPVAEKIMDNFQKCGFDNFVLTLNHKKEIVKTYFAENCTRYNVRWVEEEEYLGTAGSIGLLRSDLKEAFFVCNCDTILEHDFRNILAWHRAENSCLTVVGCHKEVVIPYGTIELDEGRLKAIKEKPAYDLIINTGMYVMEPGVLEFIGRNETLDMDELIRRVTGKHKVSVYPVSDGWFDIGQWKEYQDSIYRIENGRQR